MHRIRKIKTRYGDFVFRDKPPEGLLVTPRGRKLRRRYARLLSTLRVTPEGRPAIHPEFDPHFVGKGVHGQVFRIAPKNLSWAERLAKRWRNIPKPKTMVVKGYSSGLERLQVDGISQLVAETELYNFLKKRRNKFFVPYLPKYFFASNRFLVRKFERFPRVSDLLFFFDMTSDPSLQSAYSSMGFLSENPLSAREMNRFVRVNDISRGEVESMVAEVKQALLREYPKAVLRGKKGFPVEFDLERHNRNILVRGRDPKTRRLSIAVYDQGQRSIPNVLDHIKK